MEAPSEMSIGELETSPQKRVPTPRFVKRSGDVPKFVYRDMDRSPTPRKFNKFSGFKDFKNTGRSTIIADDEDVDRKFIYNYQKLPNRQPKKNPHIALNNFEPMEDVRRARGFGQTDLYDSLINVILNHKKEIQKIPKAMTLEGAKKYATQLGEGYRAKEMDLNPGDGLNENEVVIYNPAGRPVVINGYKLRNSDYPYYKEYYETYPGGMDEDKQVMKSFNQFMDEAYEYEPGKNAWDERKIGNPDYFANYEKMGYAKKRPRKKQLAPNQIFAKLWSQYIKAVFAADKIPDTWKLAKRLIRPLHLQQIAFLLFFDIPEYKTVHLNYGQSTNYITYESWRKFINESDYNKQHYLQDFIDRICAEDSPDRLTPQQIADMFTNAYFADLPMLDYVIDEEIQQACSQYNLINEDGFISDSNNLNDTQKFVLKQIIERTDAKCKEIRDALKDSYYEEGGYDYRGLFNKTSFVAE